MRSFRLLTLLLLAATQASADPSSAYKTVLKASLGGGYAGSGTSSGTLQGLGDLYVVPAYSTGPWNILPTLSGSLSGQQRSLDEGSLLARSASLGFSPAVKYRPLGGGVWLGRLQSLHSYNVETVDESWGKGLYDYEQYGAGLGYEQPLGDWSLGADYSYAARSYPNNRNFAAAVALTGDKNFYYKDFSSNQVGLKGSVPRLGLGASLSVERRGYGDAYVVTKRGPLDLGLLREDWVTRASLQSLLPLNASRSLALFSNLGLESKHGNQAYFDAPAGYYVDDAEGYNQESLSLALPWQIDPTWSLTPSYDLGLVQRSTRLQSMNGTYLADKQSDVVNGFSLRSAKKLPAGFEWTADGAVQLGNSNQILVRGLNGNFTYWQVNTGLNYSFGAN